MRTLPLGDADVSADLDELLSLEWDRSLYAKKESLDPDDEHADRMRADASRPFVQRTWKP